MERDPPYVGWVEPAIPIGERLDLMGIASLNAILRVVSGEALRP